MKRLIISAAYISLYISHTYMYAVILSFPVSVEVCTVSPLLLSHKGYTVSIDFMSLWSLTSELMEPSLSLGPSLLYAVTVESDFVSARAYDTDADDFLVDSILEVVVSRLPDFIARFPLHYPLIDHLDLIDRPIVNGSAYTGMLVYIILLILLV